MDDWNGTTTKGLRSLPSVVAADAVVLGLAFWGAYLLRFDFTIPSAVVGDAALQTPVVVAWLVIAAWLTGLYRIVGRYVGFFDVPRFALATLVALAPLIVVRLAAPASTWRVPISVSLMACFGGFAGLLVVRVLERASHENRKRQHQRGGASGSSRTVLIGAGDAGVQAVREVQRRGNTGLQVVGFVDDDPLKQGSLLSGIEVIGRIEDLPELTAELDVQQAIVTIVEPERELLTRITEECAAAGIPVRRIPGFFEILQGSVNITRFRDIDIEELLHRDPVQLNGDEMRLFLAGKNVMVTGAGGSIGSELARQIALHDPRRLLLIDRAEAALFAIDRELGGSQSRSAIEARVADVCDHHRLQGIFDEFRPDVVIHAAAHKHVALMEENVAEAIDNNVRGTLVVADLAGRHKAEAFVLVSTDKAVRPRSVMGASKRAAELAVQGLTSTYLDTRFVSVRFGNVMGSSGSVVPIFREQIRRGGPVTVTDPEATRFFMTIPEASQLVLQAGAIARSGEIMVLDMGVPMRIVDLAERLIELSGFRPYADIDIDFIGLKPGEKLHEELEMPGDELVPTQHPKIFATSERPFPDGELADVRALLDVASNGDPGRLRAALTELIPEADLT